MDGIDVSLEIGQIGWLGKWFIESGVICIQDKRTIGGKVRETQVIKIDEEKKWAQDRALGDTREDGDRVGGNTMDSHQL